MKKLADNKKLNYLFSVLTVALLCAGWIIAAAKIGNEYILPTFSDTVKSIGQQLTSSSFWVAFARTVGRSVLAWLIAFFVAVALVSITMLSDKFSKFIAPVVSLLRTLPTMAITLMLLIWTTPRVAPIIVALLMLFPLNFAQLRTSCAGIDPKLTELAVVYRFTFKTKLFKIYIPMLLPDIFSQAGPNLSLSLKVMLSAEVLAGTFRSVGGLMYDASVWSQMATLFALTILMLITGGVLEFALGKLTLLTDRWTKGRGNTVPQKVSYD